VAQDRFILPAGTTAYVGDRAYKSGQFMPKNLASFSVINVIESTPEQVAAGAKSSYNSMAFFAVGATRQEIASRLDSVLALNAGDWETFRQMCSAGQDWQPPEPVGDTGAPQEELFPFGAFAPDVTPPDVFGELGGEQQFPMPGEEQAFEPPQRLSLWDQLEQQIAKIGTAFGATARAIRDYFGY
jgi:hypothetical protein